MASVKSLYAVHCVYDIIAVLSDDSIKSLDQSLDQIGEMECIEKKISTIIISTKFER